MSKRHERHVSAIFAGDHLRDGDRERGSAGFLVGLPVPGPAVFEVSLEPDERGQCIVSERVLPDRAGLFVVGPATLGHGQWVPPCPATDDRSWRDPGPSGKAGQGGKTVPVRSARTERTGLMVVTAAGRPA